MIIRILRSLKNSFVLHSKNLMKLDYYSCNPSEKKIKVREIQQLVPVKQLVSRGTGLVPSSAPAFKQCAVYCLLLFYFIFVYF